MSFAEIRLSLLDAIKSMRSKFKTPNDPVVEAVNKEFALWEKWKQRADGKRILIATSMSGYLHGSSMDRVLALALTEKGHQVAFLLCDSDLEACQIIKFSSYKPDELLRSTNTPRCGKCSSNIDALFTPLGLPIHNFKSDRSDEHRLKTKFRNESFEKLREFKIDSVQVGMHAWAGAIRYFATTQFTNEPLAKEVLIRFLISGIRIYSSMVKVFTDFQPDTLIAHHGIYIPQGVMAEFARSKNINLMTWTASYRKGTFIFSPDETYHYSMVSEPTSNWDSLVLTSTQESALDKYMSSRWRGENDWIKFSDSKVDQDKSFKDKSDYYLALTSVTWDAEIHYESRAFESMREWLMTTIEYFKANPNQNLVIRVHPAEISSPNTSREPMFSFVDSLGIEQFTNITVVKPDSNLSTYNLIEKSRAVIVYNTKTGIEAAYRNKPVIVAGESWIRGKGIGWDAHDAQDYLQILDLFQGPIEMSPNQSKKAKQYAYHFFFRRMIRVSIFSKPHSSEWLFPNRKVSLKDLVGNNDENFQEILSGITSLRTPIAKVI